MFLPFEKWHGCKNDFIVTWLADTDFDLVAGSLKRQAAAITDRHSGIGADGILVLRTRKPDDLTPYGLLIINSDGSTAKNCGNGLRCAALSVLKAHREHGNPKDLPEAVELVVEDAPLVCRYMQGTSGGWPLVAVEMGVPRLDADVTWYGEARRAIQEVAGLAACPDLAREVGVCEIGNPHIVLWTDVASRELMLQVGPALQTSPAWDGMNVHIVRTEPITSQDRTRTGLELGGSLAELFRAYVWERGAGETLACGSGACAIAALALAGGLVERSDWVGVDMPGGRLYVRQSDKNEPILLAGPGAFVYEGKAPI